MAKKKKSPTPHNSNAGPNGSSPGAFGFADPQTTPADYANFSDTDRLADSKINVQHPAIQAIPPLRADPPVMSLDDVVPERVKIYKKSIVFHAVGDTGGIRTPSHQFLVAKKMVEDFSFPAESARPAFFYHLGDVVYYFGQDRYYYDQFYDPYRNYNAPVFAIPGNHDAEVFPHESAGSLDAFVKHFCSPSPVHVPEAMGTSRTTMTQPGVYFSLSAPFVKLIGLYSNTQEGSGAGVIADNGIVGQAQLQFLITQLKQAKADAKNGFRGAVILAVHHPPFTASEAHNPSPDMLDDIDTACALASFTPDLVISGHSHLYERYTRYLGGRQVPFVVAGCGGYYNLNGLKPHPVAPPPYESKDRSGNRVVLEHYFDKVFGFLRISVSASVLSSEFVGVSDDSSPGKTFDRFTLDLANHKLVGFQRP